MPEQRHKRAERLHHSSAAPHCPPPPSVASLKRVPLGSARRVDDSEALGGVSAGRKVSSVGVCEGGRV